MNVPIPGGVHSHPDEREPLTPPVVPSSTAIPFAAASAASTNENDDSEEEPSEMEPLTTPHSTSVSSMTSFSWSSCSNSNTHKQNPKQLSMPTKPNHSTSYLNLFRSPVQPTPKQQQQQFSLSYSTNNMTKTPGIVTTDDTRCKIRRDDRGDFYLDRVRSTSRSTTGCDDEDHQSRKSERTVSIQSTPSHSLGATIERKSQSTHYHHHRQSYESTNTIPITEVAPHRLLHFSSPDSSSNHSDDLIEREFDSFSVDKESPPVESNRPAISHASGRDEVDAPFKTLANPPPHSTNDDSQKSALPEKRPGIISCKKHQETYFSLSKSESGELSASESAAVPGANYLQKQQQQQQFQRQQESLSVISSSASRLMGESLLSIPDHWSGSGSTTRNAANRTIPSTSQPEYVQRQLGLLWTWLKTNVGREASAPLSPRSRRLQDLDYLLQMHRNKLHDILPLDEPEQFDFVLVLKPQNVYGFWAGLLDFRVEMLGPEVTDLLDEYALGGNPMYEDSTSRRGSSRKSTASSSYSSSTIDGCSTASTDETVDCLKVASASEDDDSLHFSNNLEPDESFIHEDISSPLATGLYHRRGRGKIDHNSGSCIKTPSMRSNFGPSLSRRSMCSPGIYSIQSLSAAVLSTVKKKPQNLFERVINENSSSDGPTGMATLPSVLSSIDRNKEPIAPTGTHDSTNPRRRWGNHVHVAGQTILSPPVRSLTRTTSIPRQSVSTDHMTQQSLSSVLSSSENRDPNVLRIEDIPNQVIARGIAARTNRTNGMLPFLNALKRGIVLRRHRPGQEAIFCRLSSPDGGDTILYEVVDNDEAMIAFKEQRVRHNKNELSGVEPQVWSIYHATSSSVESSTASVPHNFSVPDYVAANEYRKQLAKKNKLQLGKRVTELASKMAVNGFTKTADIVTVHPARNKDPRSKNQLTGTVTLRQSKSDFDVDLSFSLVIRGSRVNKKETIEHLECKWVEGDGNDLQFRYLDFEAATKGEYWLVFRGLLLLHRDAAVGRFAKQRAAGIGTHAGRLEACLREESSDDCTNRLHQDEFHEPVTAGWIEKFIVKCRKIDTTYMEGFVAKEGALPPPSDYFLGFRSPGTAIWSRLRQAGLETQRVYSLDPNRVMIKVRCPPDRLMDVAEVLRVRLKTKEGTYAAFREDMIEAFECLNDPLEGPPQVLHCSDDFQFRSSIRQTIINFIVGSRIRDSGAELSPSTDLGQMIQSRVPLHMHDKVDAIFDSWFYFWKVEHWRGEFPENNAENSKLAHIAEEQKLTIPTGSEDSNASPYARATVPNFVTRFLVGCFYQPLDSIEEYFGEKVAFYYTWLQHTAAHLVFLSIAGLILFFFQLGSGNPDHPLRPLFSMVVMIWTFAVLQNWKKRSNLMAFRWGTLNHREQETTRPQFKGSYAKDDITGEWIVIYPKWKRWLKYCISFPLTLLFTGGTLLLILWVHANRDIQLAKYLNDYEQFEFEFTVAAIGKKSPVIASGLSKDHLRNPEFWFIVVGMPSMLGLFLPLLNFILMRLSIVLNDFENYQTESEYRTFLIIKVFSFRFVCYFATLYYYAFLSTGTREAVESGILRVGSGVLVCTTVAQWWQNILHIGFPLLLRKIRLKHRNNRLQDELREIELEEEDVNNQFAANGSDTNLKKRQASIINKRLLLEQAQDDVWLELMKPAHDSFPEYIQAVVQFTFVSCFSVVLPITPLIVLFNYLISMRLDAYKLCKARQRPLAEKTGGIGVWEHLLHIVAVISVLTNCWLMGFASSQFDSLKAKVGELGLFAIIVCWEHVMLLIKYIMSTSISNLPKTVRDAMKRDQHELDKQRNALMRERRLMHDDRQSSGLIPGKRGVFGRVGGSSRNKFSKNPAKREPLAAAHRQLAEC